MTLPTFQCFTCRAEITAETEPLGVILVRKFIDNKRRTVEQCAKCWNETHMNQPVRIRWALYGEHRTSSS